MLSYKLKISTGEKFDILELSIDDGDIRLVHDVFDLCTKVTREVMEDAKNGYDKPFRNALNTPPRGALLKLKNDLCRNKLGNKDEDSCYLYTTNRCSTKKIFPHCFEYNYIGGDINMLLTQVMHAWNSGTLVVYVTD